MSNFARLAAAACLVLAMLAGRAHASTYQDFWWNPAMSGMGWNIGQQNNTVMLAWFHYAADGSPTFLTMSGELSGTRVQGTLNRSTGAPPQANYNASSVKTVPVGSALLEFTSAQSAVFTYSYDGKSGSISLERFTFAPIDINGTWRGADVGTNSSCDLSGKSWHDPITLTVSGVGSTKNLVLSGIFGGSCSGTVSVSQTGTLLTGTGTVQCADATGVMSITNMRRTGSVLQFEYQTKWTLPTRTCEEQGQFSGSR